MKWKPVAGNQNHHLFKRGTSPFFWVRFSRAPKPRLEESLKTTNLVEARYLRDQAIANYTGKKVSYKGTELVDVRFEEWRELMKIKRKGTTDSIKYQWEGHLRPYFGGMLLSEVTENEWLRYVATSRVKKPDRKFYNDRKWLSMFLIWAHRAGYVDRVPKLDNVDPPKAKGRIFSQPELERLFLHASFELHLSIVMGLTMGMRLNEIMTLAWDQVDLEHGYIVVTVQKAKIKVERKFAMSSEVWNVLKSRKERSKSPFIFPNPHDPTRSQGRQGNKTAWTNCRKLSGVKGTFHSLRKTFVTRAIKEGGNPYLICDFAGLSMKQAQETYAIFSAEDGRTVADLVRY